MNRAGRRLRRGKGRHDRRCLFAFTEELNRAAGLSGWVFHVPRIYYFTLLTVTPRDGMMVQPTAKTILVKELLYTGRKTVQDSVDSRSKSKKSSCKFLNIFCSFSAGKETTNSFFIPIIWSSVCRQIDKRHLFGSFIILTKRGYYGRLAVSLLRQLRYTLLFPLCLLYSSLSFFLKLKYLPYHILFK